MLQKTRLMRFAASVLTSAIALSTPLITLAAEDPTEVAAAVVDEKYSEQGSDVKRLFASRCSWCHQGYGMRGADGPRLAGTDKSRDIVIETIAKGKSPMPGFRKQLKPWQIESLADYIKALPDE
ncbi:MAG: cytochrome c [Betaproteobacteria bacterium]|jgi:mono/diheme cytochrome c family protein|nr:MAG: cytochrome c [Betaproteobacteria bacterium]